MMESQYPTFIGRSLLFSCTFFCAPPHITHVNPHVCCGGRLFLCSHFTDEEESGQRRSLGGRFKIPAEHCSWRAWVARHAASAPASPSLLMDRPSSGKGWSPVASLTLVYLRSCGDASSCLFFPPFQLAATSVLNIQVQWSLLLLYEVSPAPFPRQWGEKVLKNSFFLSDSVSMPHATH